MAAHWGRPLSARVTYPILPLYLVVTLAFTWPLVLHFGDSIPAIWTGFDPMVQAFLLGWDANALASHPARLFHPPIFYPERNTLTYMDHMIGESVVAAPAFLIGHSAAAAYNFLFLLSFVLSGWAVYRLARLFPVSRPAAFLAGLLFAFSPYRLSNLDLLNQLQTQFLPLGLFFGIRYVRKARTRDLVGTMGALTAQATFGWYYTYYLAVALGVLFLYALLRREPGTEPRHTGRLAVAALLTILIVFPIAVPYIREARALPEFRRSLGESALYSADVLDYVKLNQNSRMSRWIPVPTGAQGYWPGLVTLPLAILGAREVWRRRDGAHENMRRLGEGGYFVILAGVSFVLSLGPILHAAGARIWIPLPYAALYYLIPGFSSMRTPGRFASLLVLSLSVLAAFGYEWLRHRPWNAVWQVAAVGAFPLALLAAWPSPLSLIEVPSRDRLPGAYSWLEAQPGRQPVLEIPVPAQDGDENQTHAARQFVALYHGHPRLDGTSGFVSRKYRRFRSVIQSFPSSEALRAAEELGAKLIVVHFGDYPAEQREVLSTRIGAEERLRLRARFGDDVVYELGR